MSIRSRKRSRRHKLYSTMEAAKTVAATKPVVEKKVKSVKTSKVKQ